MDRGRVAEFAHQLRSPHRRGANRRASPGYHQRCVAAHDYHPELAGNFVHAWFVYDCHQWLYSVFGEQAVRAAARKEFLGSGTCRSDYRTGKLFSDGYRGRSLGRQRPSYSIVKETNMHMSVWNYITIASVLLLALLILVQTRGASLGAGLGGAGEINIVRRGTEKTIYQLTIIC